MSWCKTCGQYMLDLCGARPHRCPPKWLCWSPSYDERAPDAASVYANSPESAAEKWAEMRDSHSDYSIVGGSPVLVCVQAQRDQRDLATKMVGRRVRIFFVEGHSEPVYESAPVRNVAAGFRDRERSMLPTRRRRAS